MKLLLPFLLSFLFIHFLSAQLITQSDPLILIVDNNTDLVGARDMVPGDGKCMDMDGNCTLRAAIDEANASTGDVLIVLPGTLPGGVSGTYEIARSPSSESVSLYEDNNEYGDLDLNGSFTSLHIQGTGTPGPQIRVNFSSQERGFHIGDGKSVKIERIYFNQLSSRRGSQGNQDGSGPEGVNGTDGDDGGAIYVGANCTFEMDQVTFVQCTTGGGGQGVTPSSEAGTTTGGDGGDGGDGGAVYIGSGTTAQITRATFQGCATGGGGGAGDAGGPDGGNADGGNGGNGGNGGAIYCAGNLTLLSSTLVGNNGGGAGGAGQPKGDGQAGIPGSPAQGGGVAVAQRIPGTAEVTNEGTLDFQNNVIAKNEPAGAAQDLFQDTTASESALISNGYNMIGITAGLGTIFMEQETDTLGGMSNSLDPQAGGIQNQDTYAVPILEFGSNSLAIDNGTTIATFDYDGRGFVRGADGNIPDRGAWEYQAPQRVDSLRITEVDPNTSDGTGEFIEIYNAGNYNVQIDEYLTVAFDDQGMSCFMGKMFGEIAPGEYFVFGDSAVNNLDQPFDYAGAPDECGGADEQFLNSQGAVALYIGQKPDAFTAGDRSMQRVDEVSYDNTATRSSMMFDFCAAFGKSDGCEGSDSGDGESIQIESDGTKVSGTPNPGTSGATVPVEWLSFEAYSHKPEQVVVEWATAWEVNNEGFYIQRLDNREWVNEYFVTPGVNRAQENTYRSVLFDIKPGNHYFRIKQVDFNGEYSVTETKSVLVRGKGHIVIAPNPVSTYLSISLDDIKSQKSEVYDVMIRTINGQLVSKNTLRISSEPNNINIQHFNKGIYVISISNGIQTSNMKFTKL
ncbi:T9SS type A sorting domain-containing protein [Portibacter marinus]|uniref:T9SS type A sorting domain-containing protein n=1 Tax=Portibacter marinus TaxID=2898660 RepID=UPI001F407B84|nr:T9SS type A sorting domain-containing protein [Portibacter marinus]